MKYRLRDSLVQYTQSTLARLVLPVMLIVLLGAGVTAVVLNEASTRLDARARMHELEITRHRLASEARAIKRVGKDNSWWDDVRKNVIDTFDVEWTDANIGVNLVNEYELTGSYVVDAEDRTRYAAFGGSRRKKTNAFERFDPGLKTLIEAARAGPMKEPVPMIAYLHEAGELQLVVVSPITPEDPKPQQLRQAPRPVLILSQPMSGTRLEAWANSHSLANLRTARVAPAGAQSVPLPGPDGKPAMYLVWDPATPGGNLVSGLGGIILVALLLATGLMTFFVYRADRFANTLRQNVDDLIDAKTRAELANRSKTLFLANVSHELRTPLNAVLAFSEIMKTQAFGPVGSPKYLEYATDIHDSGTHLLALIDDLLDLSRIEANRADLQEVELDMDRIVEWATNLTEPQATSKGVTLTTDAGTGLPHIVADERAVKQILLNLLTNAVKFTDAGGHVMLMAETVKSGEFAFTVLDTGIGIPPEIISEVLLPFQQGSQSYVRNREGAGLGLALVQALCKLHDARLTIDSTPGVGTKVTVTFPAKRVIAGAVAGDELKTA